MKKPKKNNKSRILIIGDYCLDEYLEGQVVEVSPEAPILRLVVTGENINPGMTGNIAYNFNSLGGRVLAGGVLGPDVSSKKLTTLFKQKAIDISAMVTQKNRITPKFSRILTNGERYPVQAIVRFDREIKYEVSNQTRIKLLEKIKKIKNLDVIVLADYNEFGQGLINEEFVSEIKKITEHQKIKLVGDSRLRPHIFKGINLVKINLKEAREIYNFFIGKNIKNTTECGEDISRELLKVLQLDVLIITADKNGSEIITDSGEYFKITSSAKKVVDVCGAGDTFLAGFVLKWLSTGNYKKALEFADQVSAVAVSKSGVSTVSLSELKS